MQSWYSHLSYPFNAVCLVLCGVGSALASSHVLGFPQRCLVLEKVLVILLVKGSKVRNNPSSHIDDITPHSVRIIILILYDSYFIENAIEAQRSQVTA